MYYEWFKGNSRRKLYIFHRDYFTFYNHVWNLDSVTQFWHNLQ